MSALNKKVKHPIVDDTIQLAGGYGPSAAKQSDYAMLRRMVMTCLLWEDAAYVDGLSIADHISDLVPKVSAEKVAALTVEARYEQKLRHIPLFVIREMAKLQSHKHLVASTLEKVINRPDELCEFLSIYWKDGKIPISAQVKKGLAAAFTKFDEYQLAKWDKSGKSISLKDVMLLVHPAPKDEEQSSLWKRLLDGNLKTPDTWEVGLSAAKNLSEKRDVWINLINGQKLGAFAVLKNLRNMEDAGVPRDIIAKAINDANPAMLLPVNFFSAAKYAPSYIRQIEDLMFKCIAQYKKLPGWTLMIVDVSGSMDCPISTRSEFTRMHAGAAMAVLAAEMCENIVIYATAGSGSRRTHATVKIPPYRGFALANTIMSNRLGMGGIFTHQCLEYIKSEEKEIPDRIIVFSDSQDCDSTFKLPKPFGKRNYIVDVSPHKNGINYKGVWTAEISGWSEGFLRFISEYESGSINPA